MSLPLYPTRPNSIEGGNFAPSKKAGDRGEGHSPKFQMDL
jgi:hypothetical protein